MASNFRQVQLGGARPSAIRAVRLPRRERYFPSPADWRDEIIYFLLPDRFSDGLEHTRPLLDPTNRAAARPAGFGFDKWAESGGERWQGGSLKGVTSKLAYLAQLGVTTVWLGPIFKQRRPDNSYHGYAIQDFLEVDPRLGTRADLVQLVDSAHAAGLRVILDVIFNHTGNNWVYPGDADQPAYQAWPAHYARGRWRTGEGGLADSIADTEDGIWPEELQDESHYTRAGEGSLSSGSFDDPHAEFRRTDFVGLRDVNFDGSRALDNLARCYKYWIALTDCDGFRIDTLKHVDADTGRNFCGSVKEFAANLGKADFFLVGEVAGDDRNAERYREVLGTNLNATLDIGESRRLLHAVAKGLAPPGDYFSFVRTWSDDLGSHRNAGRSHVSILDDHDHVSGNKVRFSSDAASDHQVVAGVAIQLFSLGIPCVYYGSEQAFAGPEKAQRDQYLPDYNVGNPPPDKYLREAMFGPAHPRQAGAAGIGDSANVQDQTLFGFGPFGTSGAHAFNPASPAFVRIAALARVRQQYPLLRYGRLYPRAISNFNQPFADSAAGEIIAWSRILDEEEALCIVNGNGAEARGADVVVDARLNAVDAPGSPWDAPGGGIGAPQLVVVANSAQAAHEALHPGQAYSGAHPIGQRLPLQSRDGASFVAIRDLPASEVLVLINRT
jgi:glycosidase